MSPLFAQTDISADWVGLTVVEHRLNVAGGRVDDDAELQEHLGEDVARDSRLHDVGAVQAVDAAGVSLAENLWSSLSPEHALLLLHGLALQRPVIAHGGEVELGDQVRYVGPVHALAVLMEVEGDVVKVGAAEVSDELREPVRNGGLAAVLLGEVDDGLLSATMRREIAKLTTGP
jgi:hypothetical protein